jgi:hypothetical protein
MKVTQIPQITPEEDEEESDDEDDQPPAVLTSQKIKHKGAINRVAVCPHNSAFTATMSETGKVWYSSIHDHELCHQP